MKMSLLTLCLSVFACTAIGAENIEGAFGLKLGEVFEPKTEPISSYDFAAYEFEPEKRNSLFTKYVVFITPNTHRIFRIMATGTAPDSKTASKRSKALGAFLHGKYGEGPYQYRDSIVQGEKRQILLSLVENKPEKEFRVIYQDTALLSQAVEEKQGNELKSLLGEVDPTGL